VLQDAGDDRFAIDGQVHCLAHCGGFEERQPLVEAHEVMLGDWRIANPDSWHALHACQAGGLERDQIELTGAKGRDLCARIGNQPENDTPELWPRPVIVRIRLECQRGARLGHRHAKWTGAYRSAMAEVGVVENGAVPEGMLRDDTGVIAQQSQERCRGFFEHETDAEGIGELDPVDRREVGPQQTP